MQSNSFSTRLNNIQTMLEEFTKTYSKSSKILYSRDVSINYNYSNIIAKDGGLSFIIAFLASVAVAVAIGGTIGIALGYKKVKLLNKEAITN